jgi:hypothetical protein
LTGASAALALLCLLAPPAAVPEDAAASPSLRLAEQLRLVGSHRECAVEALRHAYLTPTDRERGFERAALCLGLAGRYVDAERLLRSLPAPQGPRTSFRLCWVQVRVDAGPAESCGAVSDESPWLGRAAEMPVLHELRIGRWAEARQRLAAAPPTRDATLAAWRAVDGALADRALRLPRHSPWIAGALSAVVPGLGRIYIGRWQDGLMSAVLIGIPAGFAANGFAHDGTRSVRGWLLGTAAGILYVGNVYGSAVGAVKADRDADLALRGAAEELHLGRADPEG